MNYLCKSHMYAGDAPCSECERESKPISAEELAMLICGKAILYGGTTEAQVIAAAILEKFEVRRK